MRKENVLQRQIDLLKAQLRDIKTPEDTITPLGSPPSVQESQVEVQQPGPSGLSICSPDKSQRSFYDEQAARSRSMSPVYTDYDSSGGDRGEPYDPHYPTMSSNPPTPAQRPKDNQPKVSSPVPRKPELPQEDKDEASVSERLILVRELLQIPPPQPLVDSPFTKSAQSKVNRPCEQNLPQVQSFAKVFQQFKDKIQPKDSKQASVQAVRPPTLPRMYRPLESDWQPSEQRVNQSFVHIKKGYATSLARMHDTDLKTMEKLARETLAVQSFKDQFLHASQLLLHQLVEVLEPLSDGQPYCPSTTGLTNIRRCG